MPEKNFTTKFKVDISDLKKNITEANKQIKLANATFKAETAGMTDWSKNATGLAAKLKQLNSNLDEQKKVLTSYREQLKKQNDAYTENGKRIEEARAKLKELEQTVGKSDAAYKKQKEALRAIEQEQQRNATAADKLKVQILNQTAAVNKTEAEIKKYSSAQQQLEKDTKILSGEFGTQEEKLEALKRQYDRVASSEGKDSDEARKLSKQIENLNSDLNKNQSELEQSESKSGQLKAAFSKLKDVTSNLGSKLKTSISTGVKTAAVGMATVGTAAAAAGKKIYSSAKETADYGDTVDKMSQKLGLSKKSYQEWDYVLSQSGVDIKNMSGGMKTLTNQISAAKDGNDDAIERFNKLGISLTDLQNLSREEIFSKVITGMQSMSDSTDRAALANKLFGKSGAELTPLFNQTAESTEALKKKANELGFVMSDDAVKASAGFKDSLDTLQRTFTGTKNNIIGELLPSITQVMTGLTKLTAGTSGASKDIEAGTNSLVKKLANAIPSISTIFTSLVSALANSAPRIVQTIADGIAKNAPKLITSFSKILVSLVTNVDYGKIGASLTAGFKKVDWKKVFKSGVDALGGLLDSALSIFGVKSANTRKFTDSIKSLATPIGKIFSSIQKMAEQVLPVITNKLLPAIVSTIGSIMDGISPIITALTPVTTQVTSVISDILEKLSPFLTTAGELTGKIVESLSPILEPLGKLISAIVDLLKPALDVIFGIIGGIAQLLTPISQIIGEIIGFFTGESEEETFTAKLKAEMDNMSAVSQDLSTISDNIEQSISSVNSSIKDSASNVQYIDDLQAKLDELMNKADLSEADEQQIKTIADLLSEKLPSFKETWDQMVTTDSNGHLKFSQNRQSMISDIDKVIDKLKAQYATEALQDQYKQLYQDKIKNNQDIASSIEKITEAQEKAEPYNKKATEAWADYQEAVKKYGENSKDAADKLEAYNNAVKEAKGYNDKLAEMQTNALGAYGAQGKLEEKMDSLSNTMDVLSGKYDINKDGLQKLRDAFDNGFIDTEKLKENYNLTADELYKGTMSAAEKANSGFAVGVTKGIKEIQASGTKIAKEAIKATQQGLDEHSPSKVYEGIGENASKGFNIGVSKSIESSVKAMDKFASAVVDAAKKGFRPIKTLFSSIPDALKSALNSALGYFEGSLASITSGINFMFKHINDLNKASANGKKYTVWNTFKSPTIPRLALGGVISRPTFAQIGERGAEAIIPLSQNAAWIKSVALEMLHALQAGSATNNNTQNVTNNKSTDYNFTQVINAPEAPSRLELYRQTQNILALAKATGGA